MNNLKLILVSLLISCSLWARSPHCERFTEINDTKDLFTLVNSITIDHFAKYPTLNDRHAMGVSLNICRPSDNNKVFIMSFEGTGAYEPRVPAIMKEVHECGFDFHDYKLADKIYAYSKLSVETIQGKKAKWSAIEAGIFVQLILENRLKGDEVNWVSFPSEEAEFLAGDFDYSKLSYKELLKEVQNSYYGIPKGISNALGCFSEFIKTSNELGIEPKLVIVSHSSGARSAVKFLERIKPWVADLVYTIDPVREAHEAIIEVLEQYIALPAKKFANLFIPKKYEIPLLPINVWTRPQPHSLYKTSNSKRWVAFHQNVDVDGLKMKGIKYGIHGSPIQGAENNYLHTQLGSSAHGEIGYHPYVMSRFSKELEYLAP